MILLDTVPYMFFEPQKLLVHVLACSDFTGCWLGNPNGEQVWIEGAEQGKVLAAEFISNTPSKLV